MSAAPRRSCDQLGVCQSRKPACTRCRSRFAFAPGVIVRATPTAMERLRAWLTRLGGRR